MSFWNLITNPAQLIIFFVLFGTVYPLVSFVKKDAMLIRTFSEERINILKIFDAMGYELVNETDGVLTFRLKNRFVRFMRLFCEDMIEVRYNDGKISLSGLRRDIYRLIRHIEYLRNDK
jgi:hypothetical protein